MSFDLYTWSVIIFVAILAVFIWKDRKNFKREGIVLLRRTQIGLKFFEYEANRHPKFWHWYGNIAAVLSFPIIFGFLVGLIYLLYRFLTTTQAQSAIALVLPIPIKTTAAVPGLIGVPFWHWILVIIIISVVHEFTHGILARLEKVPVKSSGFGFLGPLMMAFVETDDKKMTERGWKSTARIAAAGPFTNILFAGIIWVVMVAMTLTPAGAGFVSEHFRLTEPNGIFFNSTTPGMPAHEAGLLNGTIVAINGKQVRDIGDFRANMPSTPGESGVFTILTFENNSIVEKNYTLTAVAAEDNQSRAVIGISLNAENFQAGKFNPTFLFWLFALNLGLGLANLMPIGPIDGGRIWGEFARAKLPHGAKIAKHMSRFTIFTLLFLLITALVRNFI
jgi:membrane-associated protease RseP (regulator of RpoE activity)